MLMRVVDGNKIEKTEQKKQCTIDKRDFGRVYDTCLLEISHKTTCRHAIEQRGIKTKEQCEHWRETE